jgi:NAD(P)-dependent dehydrogenase (short-subunit alcohol dehydrogenase family)
MSRPAIFITGGAKRLGAALALHFAQGGYDIGLHYHHSQADAEALASRIAQFNVACHLLPQDMADISGFPMLMEQLFLLLPHCRTLVNNASVFERATFAETDEALFDRQFDINFKAPFFLTKAFAKRFISGQVINILDTDIDQTHGSHFAYLLSKKALAALTPMAARALGPHMRVNGICPGCIAFPDAPEDELTLKLKAATPLRAHATPQDIAATVQWLIGQPQITGELIHIDGGRHVL